jgi:hypothetical protein
MAPFIGILYLFASLTLNLSVLHSFLASSMLKRPDSVYLTKNSFVRN